MKKATTILSVFIILSLILTSFISAQEKKKEPRKSLKATVSQTIGIDTDVTFTFSRPGVKGREIWGKLVPWGMEPGNKYSGNKDFPWRGGANENTTIEFTKDLIVEGTKVPAGKYSLHFITGEKEWTIMINKVNDKWGSYEYNDSLDVAKFTVESVEAPHKEWLTYGFEDLDDYKATAYLHWEKLKIPFKIEVAK